MVFHICWLIFFAILNFFIVRYISKYYRNFSLILCAIAAFVVILFLFRSFSAQLASITERNLQFIAIVIFAIQFFLFLWVAKITLIKPFNDTASIWFSAADVVETGKVSTTIDEYTGCSWSTNTSNHDYLLIYPNSQFLVACLIPFCRFLFSVLGINLRSNVGYYCASVLNICLILLSELFLFLASKKSRGNSCAFLSMILCFFFFPYYLHAFKLYSDTMSMPLVSLAIYLMICGEKNQKPISVLLCYLGVGLSIGIGILIKGSVVVLAVACIIYLIVRQRSLKESAVQAAALLVGIAAIYALWAIYSANISWLDKTNADKFELPVTHWIMMASTNDGGFSQEELDYTMQFDTLAAKKEATKSVFTSRVKEYGLIGYLKFCLRKITTGMADGLYFQKVHLSSLKNTPSYRFLNPKGRTWAVLSDYCIVFTQLFYYAFLISGFLGIHKDNGIMFLFNICMFGIILFFTLWEFKSRYLLDYTPMFILNLSLVMDSLSERFVQQRFSNRDRPRLHRFPR